MQDRTDWGGLSESTQPTRATLPSENRSRHRLRGWTIAVFASAVLWGGIIWVAWSMVGALT